MRDIRATDLRQVIAGLGELAVLDAEGATFDTLARSMMRILLDLVPPDTINMGLIDHRTGRGSYFAYRGFLMPEDRRGRPAHVCGSAPDACAFQAHRPSVIPHRPSPINQSVLKRRIDVRFRIDDRRPDHE